jgi:hypothetical protein
MTDFALRLSRPGDEATLRSIWKLCFQESDRFLDLFFSRLYRPGMATVAELDGKIAAAAYAIPGFAVRVPGKPARPAGYIYGVCTDPLCRGRGLGEAVTRAAAGSGENSLACLMPGDEGLRGWYARAMGAYAYTRARTVTLDRRDTGISSVALRPLNAAEYGERREALLRDAPHVEQPKDYLSLAEAVARLSGGGFFALDGGLCAVELSGDTLLVKELLGSGTAVAAPAIFSYFPKNSMLIRCPAADDTNTVDFVMALPRGGTTEDAPANLYWGLVID